MENLKYFERIEAYVEGSLSETDQSSFEADLRTNAELKQEYDAYLATQKIAQVLGLQQLREMAPQTRQRQRNYRPWLAAASVLLIIFLGAIINSYINYRPTTLALQYQQAPEKAGTENNTLLKEAWVATENGDFQKTLQLLSPSRGDEVQAENAQLLYAYALLEAQQGTAALQYLSQFNDLKTRPTLSWYLVLAHLQVADRSAALDQLTLILADTNHPFYEEAVQLQGQLQSIWGRWY